MRLYFLTWECEYPVWQGQLECMELNIETDLTTFGVEGQQMVLQQERQLRNDSLKPQKQIQNKTIKHKEQKPGSVSGGNFE